MFLLCDPFVRPAAYQNAISSAVMWLLMGVGLAGLGVVGVVGREGRVMLLLLREVPVYLCTSWPARCGGRVGRTAQVRGRAR